MTNFVRRLKNITTKQKIYVGVFLFLFFLQYVVASQSYVNDRVYNFYTKTYPPYICLVSIFGVIIAFIRRRESRRAIKDKSLLSIISNDYNLSSYASLSLLSLIYAGFQGLFLGAGLGFIFFALGGIFDSAMFYVDLSIFVFNFGYFFVCVFLTLLTRIIVEGISLIFRVAEDFSKSVNR